MPKEVVKYIAYNINSNVRELEGALISLLAQSSLNRREIDLDLAKKVLRNFVKSSSKEITIETIQRMVCDFFDVPTISFFKKPEKGNCTGPADHNVPGKSFHKKSLKTIGEHFGGRIILRHSLLSNCERT
jgi:chromosomal replication initiator protein